MLGLTEGSIDGNSDSPLKKLHNVFSGMMCSRVAISGLRG